MESLLEENKKYGLPWGTCMFQMKWGIVLSFITISLTSFPLGEITTLLGAFLMLHGMFLMKDGNKSLHKAYCLSIGYFVFRCLAIIICQYDNELYLSLVSGTAFLVQMGLLYAMLDSIENGMYEANSLPGLVLPIVDSYTKIKKSLIAITVITLFSTYVIELSWLGFIVLIALVIVIVVNLSPVNISLANEQKEVEEYYLKDKVILYLVAGICLIAVITLVPAVRYLSLLKPLETYNSTVASANEATIVEQMRKAGFPEEILSQLSSEEIANYDGINKVVVQKDTGFSYMEDDETRRELEQEDLNKLDVTFVYSYFNEDAEYPGTVRVLTYGKWREKPSRTFTDYFNFYYDGNINWQPVVYGIYTTSSGEDAYYDITEINNGAFTEWFGGNVYQYTIPTKGNNYRFIAAQTVAPVSLSYSEEEEVDETKLPLYYSLWYQHKINFQKWRKLDETDFSSTFYEQRTYCGER
ncbi:MAG: hypothetical protein Q4F05_03300 [bacterium]|nr:hypothetical protein [bacterium]